MPPARCAVWPEGGPSGRFQEQSGDQVGFAGEQRVEGGNEPTDGCGVASGKLAVGREDHASPRLLAGDCVGVEATEVLNVLRDKRSLVGDGRCPRLLVRLAFEDAIGRIVH